MISLEKFIENTKGQKIGVDWNKALDGQCVSLIQQYIGQCLEQPMKARGNAKDWIQSYVAEGLGTVVTEPRKGDILVYGSNMGGGYGHIAVYIDSNRMYDQNNLTHDNLCAGYSRIFNGYTILRPNVELIEDVPQTTKLSVEEMAKKVINGEYGVGAERKSKLEAEGYNQTEVQNKVNEFLGAKTTSTLKSIDEVAREVINGKWGNGADRKARLTQAGYDPSAVQNKVNQLV